MRLEHVGIAVTDVNKAIKTFEELLSRGPYKSEVVASEGVSTHFFSAGEVKIELLESVAEGSSVARFLEKQGPGLHHLAFSVNDLAATRDRLIQSGFTVIGDTISGGSDGKRIFFVHPKSVEGVLIECCENDPQADISTSVQLPGGTHVSQTDNPSSDRHVLIADFGGHDDLGKKIAMRLESCYTVSLIQVEGEEEIVESDLIALLGDRSTNMISIGAAPEKLSFVLTSNSNRKVHWIHISTTTAELSLAHDSSKPDTVILISGGTPNETRRADAVIPQSAACPDEPEVDSLVPLIRSVWRTQRVNE